VDLLIEDTLYEKLVVTDLKNHLLYLWYVYKNFVLDRLSLVLLEIIMR
jgi:hypothetical protein